MHMGNRCTLKILLISAREWGVPDEIIERLRHAGLVVEACTPIPTRPAEDREAWQDQDA